MIVSKEKQMTERKLNDWNNTFLQVILFHSYCQNALKSI